MPDKLKMNYNLLNDAKKDLEELAGNIKPTLNNDLFDSVAGHSSAVMGSSKISAAITRLHTNAQSTMTKAEDGLKKLAGSFGSVGEAFLQFDAEIAQGMNVTNSNLALSNYYRDKSQWDYYQSHKSECENLPAGTKAPDFCSATNPGDHPPLDQTITTDRGNIQTHLTVDDKGNVIKEETTVTYDGKTYHSVTTYSDDKHTMYTDSEYPDGSKVHDETTIKTDGGSTSTSTSTDHDGKKDVTVTDLGSDGAGTKKVTDSDGEVTEYTRGADNEDGTSAKWVEVPKPEDDYYYYPMGV
ncbi:hypothetical protein E1263_25525 [Kribbella antibiotica]|uniref:Uncharacterized protein n=1 Tax=Kribbella antibiotica TaxID=190195 RepID=A0A4R4ZDG1_9ACTN|nr:hypothetical protein [Kribbella antibiotica]TDD56335.1 hypothetical protein E1263_25525 [Kribbella antibiotica]